MIHRGTEAPVATAKVVELQPRWLSVKSAADYCSLGQSSIRKLISGGKLVPRRPAKGKILLDKFEIDAFVGSCTKTPRVGRGLSKH